MLLFKKSTFLILLFFVVNITFAESRYSYMQKINFHLKNGRKKLALNELKKLLKQYPERNTYLFAGITFVKLNQRKIAKKYWYRGVLKIRYEYAVLERIFFKYSLYEELEKLYVKVIKANPKNSYVGRKLLRVYLSENKVNDFFILLKRMIKIRNRINYYFISDTSKMAAANPQKSEIHIKEILQYPKLKRRGKIALSNILIEIYLNLKKYKLYFDLVYKLVNNNVLKIWQLDRIFGKMFFLPDNSSIISIAKKIIKLYPYKPNYKIILADYYIRMNSCFKAIALLKDAIKYAGQNTKIKIINTLCDLYIKLKMPVKAAAFARLLPEGNKRFFYLGLAELLQSRIMLAEKNFNSTNINSKYYFLAHINFFKKKDNIALKMLASWVQADFASRDISKGFKFIANLNIIGKNKNAKKLYISFMKHYLTNKDGKLYENIGNYRNTGELYPYLLIKLAQSYFYKQDYNKSLHLLKQAQNYKNFYGEKALFFRGMILLKKMGLIKQGEKVLYKLISDFPDTVYKERVSKLLIKENKN